MRRTFVGLAVSWTVGVAPATAQAVVGIVTEEGSGRPVVGAMVRLLDAGVPTGARYLTAADGAYRLVVPGPGSYRIEVDRIGFERVRVGPVAVDASGSVVRDIEVSAAPIRLAGLEVEGDRRRCSLDESGAGRTQVVWDQTRKALDAATWTAREAGLTFEIGRRVRRLDMDGEHVVDESRQVSRSTGGNSVRTLGPRDLAQGGYVREADGYLFYYGPDAAVLLSDAFLETHCFTIVDGDAERPGLLGLAFEPVEGRDTTDIRGTMWVDADDLRLARVEFTYTGLPSFPGRELARGEVTFLELADGHWVVRDWFIQAPLLQARRAIGVGGRLQDRFMVTGVQELGSEVLRVEGPDGVLWDEAAPAGAVGGVVVDSVRGGPLVGAEVRLAGRGRRTRTDGTGTWRMDDVPPGTYRVGFTHPAVDTLGLDPGWWTATVHAGGGTTDVAMALRPISTLLALGCGDDAAGAVVGYVVDESGVRVPGAEVLVVDDGGPAAGRRTSTDEHGAFRLCGMGPNVELRLRARLRGAVSADRSVRTDAGRPARIDLRLPAHLRNGAGKIGTRGGAAFMQ